MIWSINSIEAQKWATDDHPPLLWVALAKLPKACVILMQILLPT